MASIKISELEKVTTLSESDTLPITNEGETKQVAISKLGEILATREYVDDAITNIDIPEGGGEGTGGTGGSNSQVSAMPEPTEENEGNIVQYVGDNNDKYTKGYFYRSSSDDMYHMESITSTGGYSVTDIVLGADYKIEMKTRVNKYVSNSHFFASNGSTYHYCLRLYNNTYYYGLNNSNVYIPKSYTLNEDLTLVYNDDNNNITINDEIIVAGITTPTATNNKLYIFNSNSNMTFYYCKVWDKTTGELVGHFVPAVYNGSNVIHNLVTGSNMSITNQSLVTPNNISSEVNKIRYWMPQYVQELVPAYNWSNAKQTPKFYEDLKEIVDLYRTGVTANYRLSGYNLGHITIGGTSSSQNYRAYTLYFYRFYDTTGYRRSITFYTTYDDYLVYDQYSPYGPSIGADSSFSIITSHQSLSNYLSKTNATAYTPTSDYHPSTKKYVDDSINDIPHLQSRTMSNIDSYENGTIVQYIGETNDEFTKGYFYRVNEVESDIKGQVEYAVISSGTHVITDLIPTNHKVEMCFEWLQYINDSHAFGTYDPTNAIGGYYMHFTSFNNRYFWGVNGQTERNGGSFKTGLHTVVFNETDGNGGYQLLLNGTVLGTEKSMANTPLLLFGRGNAMNFYGNFYYFKVWDLDTQELVMHIVPRVNSQGIAELYDAVTNEVVYTGSGITLSDKLVTVKNWEHINVQPTANEYNGYDENKTQVLKNINGVITWTDDTNISEVLEGEY